MKGEHGVSEIDGCMERDVDHHGLGHHGLGMILMKERTKSIITQMRFIYNFQILGLYLDRVAQLAKASCQKPVESGFNSPLRQFLFTYSFFHF